MSLEEVLALLVAILAGGSVGLGYALTRKRKKEMERLPAPLPSEHPTSDAVVDAGLEPVRVRLADAADDVEAVEDSPTPATDAARLASDRARHREE